MKLLKLILLLVIPFSAYTQSELSLDNNITGIYSRSTSRNLDLSLNGQNFFSYKKFTISSSTFYLLSLNDKSSDKMTGNELMQKVSFDHQHNNFYKFVFYQYNSSLIRNITSENWTGLGLGYKKKIYNSVFNISYATMLTTNNKQEQILRHSFKFKYKTERKLFSINSEYFYQPNIFNFNDYIIIGTTTLVILPQNKINFSIQNVLNIRSTESVKIIETLTLGMNVKFAKKFEGEN